MSTERVYKAVRLPPIRLTAEELQEARGNAEEQGETLSEFVRRSLTRQIARDRLVLRLAAARAALSDGQVFIEDPQDQE